MAGGHGANPCDGKCHRNKPPPPGGKGEKVGQEPTGARREPARKANPFRSKPK